MLPHSEACESLRVRVLLLKLVYLARKAALLTLILCKNTHASESTLFEADQVVFTSLSIIVALNMRHHKDGHALLN